MTAADSSSNRAVAAAVSYDRCNNTSCCMGYGSVLIFRLCRVVIYDQELCNELVISNEFPTFLSKKPSWMITSENRESLDDLLTSVVISLFLLNSSSHVTSVG
ncbi:hypothetical protein FRX31_011936 [Thalictrum thalictroides]|uniref:Uncharacterized protein n=1 Tax=Thalictrum thalictroides TaxID=46969 RepID=A0A7J6WPV3_THATH|nr:hypothetical protein FRX31_011936 [Thalictrum thalictroides]